MKEFIKSLLLIALTFSAILMTRTIFVAEPKQVVSEEIVVESNDLIDYIQPQNYIFSFGDSFIKLYEDHYASYDIRQAYEAAFNAFFTSPTTFTIAQTQEQNWNNQIQRKSLLVKYPFPIQLGNLLELYNYNPKIELDDVHISEMLFLLNKQDTIYIYDGKNNQYFRLTGEKAEQWITEAYNHVNANKTELNLYRTMEDRYKFLKTGLKKYNLQTPNLLLTPFSEHISYPTGSLVKEVDLSGSSSKNLDKLSSSVFGDDLSFVKKSVYADESVIYMYGYGEKVFEANTAGSLTYTEKAQESTKRGAVDFIDGLAESIEQIGKMGVTMIPSLYLADYYQIETNNAIETIYEFNGKQAGIPLFNPEMKSGNLIEVRFLNTDLVRVKRDARIIINTEFDDFQRERSFKSIMNMNRIDFELQYPKDRPETTVEESDYFEMALQEMSQLELEYYMMDDILVPVWDIVIAKTNYKINLTTGLIIKEE